MAIILGYQLSPHGCIPMSVKPFLVAGQTVPVRDCRKRLPAKFGRSIIGWDRKCGLGQGSSAFEYI